MFPYFPFMLLLFLLKQIWGLPEGRGTTEAVIRPTSHGTSQQMWGPNLSSAWSHMFFQQICWLQMTVCDKWPPEHIGVDGAGIWHKAPGFHKHVPRKQVAVNFHQLNTPKTSKSSYLKYGTSYVSRYEFHGNSFLYRWCSISGPL